MLMNLKTSLVIGRHELRMDEVGDNGDGFEETLLNCKLASSDFDFVFSSEKLNE